MKKILFDHSIFLHQNNGGISKYISQVNKKLQNFEIVSKIYSPYQLMKIYQKKIQMKYFI